MEPEIQLKPLPYKTRQKTFTFLLLIFIVAIPFLYLYATGYRFDFRKPTNLVSTGGMYIAVDGTGAEIYIDGELVRETRTFRRAFYAQNLDAGTHRVHVQKEGHHTWVKELPVSKRLVTEAEAFNLPLVPQVRVISEWETATGSMLTRTPIKNASSSNEVVVSTLASSRFALNDEYAALEPRFATVTAAQRTPVDQIRDLFGDDDATTTPESFGMNKLRGGARLYKDGDELYANWVGSFEQMPYYYCAPDFPPYSTSTESLPVDGNPAAISSIITSEGEIIEGEIIHPVQTIPSDITCNPTIQINRMGQEIRDFDFLPNSTDFVLVVLEDGIYVAEIDDRSWQNMQPLLMGEDLQMYIEDRNIFVYDGTLIYQVPISLE